MTKPATTTLHGQPIERPSAFATARDYAREVALEACRHLAGIEDLSAAELTSTDHLYGDQPPTVTGLALTFPGPFDVYVTANGNGQVLVELWSDADGSPLQTVTLDKVAKRIAAATIAAMVRYAADLS